MTVSVFPNHRAGTYKQSSHGPIREWKTFNPLLFRQIKHQVQKCDEAGGLHSSPSNLARDVETRCGRGLPHRIVLYEPLKYCELRAWVSERYLGTVDGIPYNREELPEQCDQLPVLAGGRTPSWYDGHGVYCC